MASSPAFVTVQEAGGVIELRLPPYLDLDSYRKIQAQVLEEEQRLRAAGRTPLLLVDTSQQGAQSQEIVDAIQDFTKSVIGRKLPTAVIAQSAIRRLQSRRVGVDGHRIFDNERDALDWLLTQSG